MTPQVILLILGAVVGLSAFPVLKHAEKLEAQSKSTGPRSHGARTGNAVRWRGTGNQLFVLGAAILSIVLMM